MRESQQSEKTLRMLFKEEHSRASMESQCFRIIAENQLTRASANRPLNHQ